MKAFVVDTNVPVVANNRNRQRSPECILSCADALKGIQRNGIIVIDDAYHILREYQRHLSTSGQPGLGDAFLKWVIINQANTKRCERVSITPARGWGPATQFKEFPNDPDLSNFDPNDRKFVAVALKSVHQPPILNAGDRGWWDYKDVLLRHGVKITFLCPDLMHTHGR